jgi:hypothetical protein
MGNDIVMTSGAGGLRQYVLSRKALPERRGGPMVPVPIRAGGEGDPGATPQQS